MKYPFNDTNKKSGLLIIPIRKFLVSCFLFPVTFPLTDLRFCAYGHRLVESLGPRHLDKDAGRIRRPTSLPDRGPAGSGSSHLEIRARVKSQSRFSYSPSCSSPSDGTGGSPQIWRRGWIGPSIGRPPSPTRCGSTLSLSSRRTPTAMPLPWSAAPGTG